jgi:hypothetical protein
MLYAWLSAASVMSAAAGRNGCRLKATAKPQPVDGREQLRLTAGRVIDW